MGTGEAGQSSIPLAEPLGLRRRAKANGTTGGGGERLLSGEESVTRPTDGHEGAKLSRETPTLPKEDQYRSRVARLWLESRLAATTKPSPPSPTSRSATATGENASPYRAKGEDRPVTKANIKIAILLIHELWRPFLALFWDGHQLQLLGFLARTVFQGLLPACKAWSAAEILDLVQRSFSEQVSTYEILRTATLSMLFTASNDIYRLFAGHQDNLIRTLIDHTMERSYLSAQLSLSIPSTSSPYVAALLYEAGIFGGFESGLHRDGSQHRSGGPFNTMQSLFGLITTTVDIITQILLLFRTLSSGTRFSLSTVALISLSLAPSTLRVLGAWLTRASKMAPRVNQVFRRRRRIEESALNDMGRRGDYKQEVVLFGLRDWIMERWDRLQTERVQEQLEMKERSTLIYVGLGLGQHGVQTAFYILLSMRIFATDLSLGSIRLYQSIADSLLGSVQSLTYTLESAFQTIFYLAAFLEATRDPEGTELSLRRVRTSEEAPLVDYEEHRQAGGMTITARNLGFTYPGSTKPVLRDINLTIKAGETLAIVGFNGGGKTTLVKALMGLYDHTGDLLINGRPVEDYVPHSLHRRTSCLFQDFSKYSFTLRENVGIGDVSKMGDDAQIGLAIERGGAEKILEKVGLEGKLNKSGVPDVSTGEDITVSSDTTATQTMDAGEDKPRDMSRGGRGSRGRGGPPGGGRGRGGGRGPPSGEMYHPQTPAPPSSPPPISAGPAVPLPGLLQLAFGHSRGHAWPREKEDRAALSGGQWQRVALARAFLRSEEADLVVFDEPSASLDPRAESTLFQRIHALSNQNGQRTTTIYISHRFSTVRKADQIAVVEDGTIVEVGSHTELMALDGRYAELFNLQKEGFA